MSALSQDRVTAARSGSFISLPIAAGTTCYGGGIAVAKSDGTVRPAIIDSDAPTCKAVGRFQSHCTSSANVTAIIEPGIFLWNNSTTDPVDAASFGAICYAIDDQTVAKTSNTSTRTPVGVVVGVESIGVWVFTKPW
jgi:hypothetical protein